MTASLFTRTEDGAARDDELHSPLLDRVELQNTPAQENSVTRFTALGLSQKEVERLLKE